MASELGSGFLPGSALSLNNARPNNRPPRNTPMLAMMSGQPPGTGRPDQQRMPSLSTLAASLTAGATNRPAAAMAAPQVPNLVPDGAGNPRAALHLQTLRGLMSNPAQSVMDLPLDQRNMLALQLLNGGF